MICKCLMCGNVFAEPKQIETTYESYYGVFSLFPDHNKLTMEVCPYCNSEDIKFIDLEKISNKTKNYVDDRLVPNRFCNRCGRPILKSDVPEEYPFQCMHCDEDLYEIETHLDYDKKINDFEMAELFAETEEILKLE